MLTTSQLIAHFLELKTQIERQGPTPRHAAVHKALNSILKVQCAALQYQELKAVHPDVHIRFFEDDVDSDPVTKDGVRQLRNVSREIGRTLKKPKQA